MLGLIALAALGAASPFLSKMASQLTAERIKEWQALSGFDQKKAYLKKAFPKDSAIQDMLKNRDQAERIIAWLDHFIASGAAETASEGAGDVVNQTLSTASSLSAGKASTVRMITAKKNAGRSPELFEYSTGKPNSRCPYSGKLLHGKTIARPSWDTEAPWGLCEVVEFATFNDIENAKHKTRFKQNPLKTYAEPPKGLPTRQVPLAQGTRYELKQGTTKERCPYSNHSMFMRPIARPLFVEDAPFGLADVVMKLSDKEIQQVVHQRQKAAQERKSTPAPTLPPSESHQAKTQVSRLGLPIPSRFTQSDHLRVGISLKPEMDLVPQNAKAIVPYTQVDVLRLLDRSDLSGFQFALLAFGLLDKQKAFELNDAAIVAEIVKAKQEVGPDRFDELMPKLHNKLASMLVKYLPKLTDILNTALRESALKFVTNPNGTRDW